jgi:hypothetical protein
MSRNHHGHGIRLTTSEATRREQELCAQALDTGDFDDMSDAEWVALCEKLSREEDSADEAGTRAGSPSDVVAS